MTRPRTRRGYGLLLVPGQQKTVQAPGVTWPTDISGIPNLSYTRTQGLQGATPGLTTRRVQTEVTVRDGDTIVLSGLFYLTEAKDVTKVPILGHIPIIGELFESRQFRDSQTEPVVFVTPRLVDPVAKSLRELSTQILNKYKDAEDDVGFGLLD